jgi:hypothetical protein
MDIGEGITFQAGITITPDPTGPKKAIFGYGYGYGGLGITNITNLVSDTGVVAGNSGFVGTQRQGLAAAGYGTDKALFGYGSNSVNTTVSMTNKVSNTGAVASDTTGVAVARTGLAAATYGTDKAIFGYGVTEVSASSGSDFINLVSNTGVVASFTSGVGTGRNGLAAAGYGRDKALFGFGSPNNGSTAVSTTNLVSNAGVVAGNTSSVASPRMYLAAATYGTDKAIFGFGTDLTNITNLVSNTGVVATDTAGVGTRRYICAAAGYGGDKALFGYGYYPNIYVDNPSLSVTNLVSNTGVVATDTAGVGSPRQTLAAASYSA